MDSDDDYSDDHDESEITDEDSENESSHYNSQDFINKVDVGDTNVKATKENIEKYMIFKKMVKDISEVDIEYMVKNDEIYSTHMGEILCMEIDPISSDPDIEPSELSSFLRKIILYVCGTHTPKNDDINHFTIEDRNLKIINKTTKKYVQIHFGYRSFDYGYEDFNYDYSYGEFKMNKYLYNLFENIFSNNKDLLKIYVEEEIKNTYWGKLANILKELPNKNNIQLEQYITITKQDITFTFFKNRRKIEEIIIPNDNFNYYLEVIYKCWEEKYKDYIKDHNEYLQKEIVEYKKKIEKLEKEISTPIEIEIESYKNIIETIKNRK